MSGHPPVIAVSGVKNSGKTTLLIRTIPLLKEMGLSLAVIKHDGHDFVPDVPETDSFRLREAGAGTVAVFSNKRFSLVSEGPGATLDQIISLVGPADLILVEGAKHSSYPKIEIVRSTISWQSVCHKETLLALCTDTDLSLPGVPAVGLDDYAEISRIIGRHLGYL